MYATGLRIHRYVLTVTLTLKYTRTQNSCVLHKSMLLVIRGEVVRSKGASLKAFALLKPDPKQQVRVEMHIQKCFNSLLLEILLYVTLFMHEFQRVFQCVYVC